MSENLGHQDMLNALINYQRKVAEDEIRSEEPDTVKGMWLLAGELVDGYVGSNTEEGYVLVPLDAEEKQEIINDLTVRLGGMACEVGRDLSVSKKQLVELCFRDMMDDLVDQRTHSNGYPSQKVIPMDVPIDELALRRGELKLSNFPGGSLSDYLNYFNGVLTPEEKHAIAKSYELTEDRVEDLTRRHYPDWISNPDDNKHPNLTLV